MYNSKIENNFLVFTFPEKIDHNACSDIEKDIISKILEKKIPVIFDLENVVYIVSSFLGICNKVYGELGKDKFTIINTPPHVYEIFSITRLNELFNIRLQI